MTVVGVRESRESRDTLKKTALDQAPAFQSPCLARKAIAGVQNDSGAGEWWLVGAK